MPSFVRAPGDGFPVPGRTRRRLHSRPLSRQLLSIVFDRSVRSSYRARPPEQLADVGPRSGTTLPSAGVDALAALNDLYPALRRAGSSRRTPRVKQNAAARSDASPSLSKPMPYLQGNECAGRSIELERAPARENIA